MLTFRALSSYSIWRCLYKNHNVNTRINQFQQFQSNFWIHLLQHRFFSFKIQLYPFHPHYHAASISTYESKEKFLFLPMFWIILIKQPSFFINSLTPIHVYLCFRLKLETSTAQDNTNLHKWQEWTKQMRRHGILFFWRWMVGWLDGGIRMNTVARVTIQCNAERGNGWCFWGCDCKRIISFLFVLCMWVWCKNCFVIQLHCPPRRG